MNVKILLVLSIVLGILAMGCIGIISAADVDPMTPTDPPAKFKMGSNQTVAENQTVYGHDPAASENKTPGKIYMSPVGPLKLKSGSIESGDFEVWDIDDYNYIFTGTLVINGTTYDVVFALVGEGGKICTVSKVAVDEPQFIGDNVEHNNITFQSTKKGKPVSTEDESDDDTVVVVVPKNAKRVVVRSEGNDNSAESESVNVENESGSDVEVDTNNSSKDNNDKKADDKQDGGIMGILQNCKGLISVIFTVLAIIGAGYKRF